MQTVRETGPRVLHGCESLMESGFGQLALLLATTPRDFAGDLSARYWLHFGQYARLMNASEKKKGIHKRSEIVVVQVSLSLILFYISY